MYHNYLNAYIMTSTAYKDPLTTDEGSQKPGTEATTVAMFSVELHKWGEQVFQERGSPRLDYALRPDGPMSQAFTTASPSKCISGDFPTAVRELC
jgi:hypothetical protein